MSVPLTYGINLLISGIPWYFIACAPFWSVERMKKSRVLAACCAVCLLRAIGGYFIAAYATDWEIWDDHFTHLHSLIMVAVYFACFRTQIVKILYTMLLIFSFATFVNFTTHTLVMLISPDVSLAYVTPQFAFIVPVILALISPLAYRFFKSTIRNAFNELTNKNILYLCIAPALFYVLLYVYFLTVFRVDGIPPMGAAVTRILIMLVGIISFYINVNMVLDTTKRIRTEKELAAENAALASLSRMKTEYLANMSHEIKTPLTVISGNIQRAAEIFNGLGIENELITRSLNKADDEIMRLARLTKDAVRMAAMQESREKRKPLDLTSLYTANTEAYRVIIEKNGNTLTIKTEKNLPPVSGNADQLIQVLTNLLVNANAYTKNGGISITLDSKVNAGLVTVTVTDTGAGISPELLPYVFQRGMTGSDGGTGMGLAICKSIIETHGGTIKIESTQGKGTAVTFTLPVFIERRVGARDV